MANKNKFRLSLDVYGPGCLGGRVCICAYVLRKLVFITSLAAKLVQDDLYANLAKQGKSGGLDSCDRPSNLTQIGFKSPICRPCDLEIWWMNPKNNKARLLYDIKLCVSYQIHKWIQTGVTVRKPQSGSNLIFFFSRMTLQFDVWPWKTIGHLFYSTSSLCIIS